MLIQRFGFLALLQKASSEAPTPDPFRSYCDAGRVTDTSTFLTFGSREWNDSENFQHHDKSQWRDDRDDWILENDDDTLAIPFDCNFGGDFFDRFCISSNGPIYMGNCPNEPDWVPYPISTARADKWTGVSAFWADFRANNGGNIYYRKVSLEDNNLESTIDLLIISNKVGSEELVREAYIITFHKIAEQNDKNECEMGVSFQYIIVPRAGQHDNPYIHIAYGEFGWDTRVLTAGWNAYHTSAEYAYNFIEDHPDVASVPDLARRSFTCDGETGCFLSDCQEKLVYDNVNDKLVCGPSNLEYDIIEAHLSFSIDLNQDCDPDTFTADSVSLYPEVENFLEYAYQWSDVDGLALQEVKCTERHTTDIHGVTTTRTTVEMVVASTVQQSIASGLSEDRPSALSYIEEVTGKRLNVPVSSMEVWSQLDDVDIAINEGLEPNFLSHYNIREPTIERYDLICSWGRNNVDNSCVNIDECSVIDLADLCGTENVDGCNDLSPGYECRCLDGYEAIVDVSSSDYNADYPNRGPFVCMDINECWDDTLNECSVTQDCVNTQGSFTCVDTDRIMLEDFHTQDLIAHALIADGWGTDTIRPNSPITSARNAADDLYNKHGCICKQLEDYPRQNTVPSDPIDDICRKFSQCQMCVYRERKHEAICKNVMFDVAYDTGTGEYTCAYPGTCNHDFCECSKQFAIAVGRLIQQEATFRPDRKRRRDCTSINNNNGDDTICHYPVW